jgi:hypothetical protein
MTLLITPDRMQLGIPSLVRSTGSPSLNLKLHSFAQRWEAADATPNAGAAMSDGVLHLHDVAKLVNGRVTERGIF